MNVTLASSPGFTGAVKPGATVKTPEGPDDKIPAHDSGIVFWLLVAAEVVMLGFVFLWMAAQQVGY